VISGFLDEDVNKTFSLADIRGFFLDANVERGFVSTYVGGNPKLMFTRGSLSTDLLGIEGVVVGGFDCIGV